MFLSGLNVIVLDRLPLFLLRFLGPVLNLPGVIYCHYLMASEALPDDDIPLFQAGQEAQCYFAGLALNTPYYALLVFIAWWLLEKWNASR